MIGITKMNPIKIFIVLSICVLVTTNVYTYVDINGSGQGYNESNDGDKQTTLFNNYIEGYIIEAAGYFLQAHSEILYFSNLYEMSVNTIDFDLWRLVLSDAKKNVQDAKLTYKLLIAAAEETPYNQKVIDQLLNFDYKGFGTRNNLNMELFGEVEVFLKNGNITGIYKDVFERMEIIETILNRIEGSVNTGTVPELSDIWQLNEVCSQKLMFGQYVAMVFENLNY